MNLFIDTRAGQSYNLHMKRNHTSFAVATISTLSLLVASALVSCTARRQLDASSVNRIRCEYTFLNTERQDADRIASVIERYRMEDFAFFISVGSDSIYCEFTVAHLSDVDMLHRELKHLPELRQGPFRVMDATSRGEPLVFAESDPVMKLTYRTARLEAGLQMLLRFRISPGARLFYAAEGEYEEEVDEIFIGDDGMVSLSVSVKENQRFIYGRTAVDQLIKCIRINIYTSETEEISLEEYRMHVRTLPGTGGL